MRFDSSASIVLVYCVAIVAQFLELDGSYFGRALVLRSEVQFGHYSFGDARRISAVEVRARHILPRCDYVIFDGCVGDTV